MSSDLKHFFLPHEHHVHKRHFFKREIVGILLLCIFIAYCGYATLISNTTLKTSLLGSVLEPVLMSRTNAVRTEAHLSPVTIDPLLSRAAQEKANDMVAHSYFAHTSPDGKNPWYWLEQMHYNYSYAGENLAINFDESADIVNAWVASPAHYENLINPKYTNVGFGIAQGTFNGAKTTFVVQLFATPNREPVAVAYQETVPPQTSESNTAEILSEDFTSDIIPLTPEEPLVEELVLDEAIPVSASVLAENSDTTQPQHVQTNKTDLSWYTWVLASPRTSLSTLLIALLALVGGLLLASFILHKRIPHREVVLGSATLAGFAAIILLTIQTHISEVTVPIDNQEASVTAAFTP
jgi:uncharacterized protein YkwD